MSEIKQILEFCINRYGLVIFGALVLIFGGVLGFFLGLLIQHLKTNSKIKQERQDAIKKSRAVLGGQIGEQLAPYFPNFPCNPADVRFIGKPIDYIAFVGSAEGKSISEILFIEVKTGKSQLSEREKEIKSLVKKARVRYVEYYIK